MNVVDLIALLLLLFFGIKGGIKGIFNQLFQIAGILLGLIAGFVFYQQSAEILASYLDSEYIELISFSLLFILVFLGFMLIGRSLTKLTKELSLGPINRFLGFCFGILKAALLLYLFLTLSYVVIETTGVRNQHDFEESVAYSIVLEINREYNLIPVGINDRLDPGKIFTLEELKHRSPSG